MKSQKFGIKAKLIIALSGFSIIIVSLTGILAYQLSKNALEKQAFDQLTSIRETKKKAITDYFGTIKNQVVTLSQDLTVIESAKLFSKEFEYLDTNLTQEDKNTYLASLNNYYSNNFIDKLNSNTNSNNSVKKYLPTNNKTIVAQYHYLSNNSNPVGGKNALNKANDGSKYSAWHEKVHPILNDYLEKFGYYDIFIINKKGDIVYSVFKEVDYATNLKNGPYSKTNFAEVYRSALNSNSNSDYFVEDFKFYAPSYGAPASFAASPIYDGNNKIGVLVFQMPIDNINSIMTGDNNWKNDGLGNSGETYLVGSDYKMRSASRFLIEDKDGYLNALSSIGVGNETIKKISQLETSILTAPVETESSKKAIAGNEGEEIVLDYRGIPVLSAYAHLSIEGFNWAILSEIDDEEAFESIYKIRNLILIAGLILTLAAAFFANMFAQMFTKPIITLKNIFQNLAKGVLPPPVKVVRQDEIGQTNTALNQMVESLQQASAFALEIGDGKFDSDFQAKSEEDTLGNALVQMRDRLSEVATEERKRAWSIEGLAIFSDILRRNNDNLEVLSNEIISEFIKYLGANQGAIFVVENDEHSNAEPILRMTGCYAYSRQKFIEKEVKKGEGLAGQCWIERKKIVLKDVPNNYVTIQSGLGDAPPNMVLIAPIMVNDEIMGVVEIAGFSEFEEHQIEFVEKVSESIASTLKGVKTNVRTVKLLEESKDQAETMMQQEEEMRQNMEEMQATQEMFDQKEDEYRREIGELKKEIKELKG